VILGFRIVRVTEKKFIKSVRYLFVPMDNQKLQ
jgi:hypothetical protein